LRRRRGACLYTGRHTSGGVGIHLRGRRGEAQPFLRYRGMVSTSLLSIKSIKLISPGVLKRRFDMLKTRCETADAFPTSLTSTFPLIVSMPISPSRLRVSMRKSCSELPKVKAQADHYGKLWMYAGKVARDDGVECSHNRQFPAVFLREITECKKLYFNFNTSIKPRKRRC